MSVRDSFVAAFGEEQALAVEAARAEHRGDHLDDRDGSDPFRTAIAICLGFECMSKDSYRESHGITVPWEDIRVWIKAHGDLANHDGGIDHLMLFGGGYNEFMPDASPPEATP